MTGHGGDVFRASRETGIPVSGIIDFSASINPLGVPASVAAVIRESIGYLPHYPDPFADELALHLGAHLGLEPGTILCGNGSTELIYLAARALSPRKVLIPAPTFSEYERACAIQRGTSYVLHALAPGSNFDIDVDAFIGSLAGCDMVFLCNPNNPTGLVLKKDAVLAIADAADRNSCYLVVDEAFIDFAPEHSVIHEVARHSHLIVLRSLTKFYALSGLRVGYGVFPAGLYESIKKYKEPWTVNTLAQKAGITAIHDRDYSARTMTVIHDGKQFLEQGLQNLDIEYIPSAANYYLLKLGNAPDTIAALRKKGILVRDCSNFAGLDGTFVRIAVKSERDNAALLKEFASCAVLS
jgi:threonine-phosphate decarboxylase